MERVRIDFESGNLLTVPGVEQQPVQSVADKTQKNETSAPSLPLEPEELRGKDLLARASWAGDGIGLRTSDIVARSLKLVTHKRQPHEGALLAKKLESSGVMLRDNAGSALAELSRPLMTPPGASEASSPKLSRPNPVLAAEPQLSFIATEMPSPREELSRNPSSPPVGFVRGAPTISLFDALSATLFDIAISAASVFAAFVFSAELGGTLTSLGERVLIRAARPELIGSYHAVAPVLHPVVLALGVTFFIQMLSYALMSASFGRALFGIRLRHSSLLSEFIKIPILSFLESVTLGGLVTLPFNLAWPQRFALLPWVRFEPRRSGDDNA